MEAAARALDDLTKHQTETVGGITPDELAQLAKALRASDPAGPKPLKAELELRLSRQALSKIPQAELPVVKALVNASTGTPYVTFVRTRVKQFFKAYALGARNPDAYFRQARLTHPQVVSRWEGMPLDRRIFLIGAGKDDPFVRKYIEEQEKDGYTVFFYKDCEHTALASCDDAVVGAFMATAGHVLVLVSPFSEASLFVSLEAAVAERLRSGQKVVLMVSPLDVLVGLEEATRTAVVLQQQSQ